MEAKEHIILELEGAYLTYSYDHNQIFGEDVVFDFLGYVVNCRHIRIDLVSRSFYAFGDVRLKSAEETLSGDEFFFNPGEQKGLLIAYTEEVAIKAIGGKQEKDLSVPPNVLENVTLSRIQKSLIYFTCKKIFVTESFEVKGEGVVLYLEGIESVGFKKFRLSQGLKQRRGGFSLDKIWFTKSQGIITRGSYLFRSGDTVNSLTRLSYEERSVLKDYSGADRQVDVLNSTSVVLSGSSNLSFTGNYNSSSLWNTSLVLNKRWSSAVNTSLDFSYNKPINYRGEAWFGFQSSINGGKYGDLLVSGRYEAQNQILANLIYGKTFLKNFSLLLNSSYSRVKIAGSDDFSEILTGGMSLSYNSRLFNLSTDYYLNYDLFGSQLLSQPQLRLGINPIAFYGGILSASITNIFLYNDLRLQDSRLDTYSNNTIFNLSTQPIYLRENLFLNFNVSVEQFLEKENRNFTSGGFIGNASYELVQGLFLEGFYSYQSRRRTRNWLIEGTTSQDLSALVRLNPSDKLNSWVSFSYDPKYGQWRQSFADVSFTIIEKWKFHSLFHYDFILKKMNNVDLYLIREAGRFQLRFVYRSLSRQFLIELIPR
ncbi:MAG: hypothetical protein JXB23_00575 [Candidatus Aminicenantes bacterium]|nr:hypothetical protein [Candidatus Aminicenantes bacterium]